MNVEDVEPLVAGWLRAWNDRDVDGILSHYADDVEFQSLIAVKLLGIPSGAIRGTTDLRRYFETVLAAFPGSPELERVAVFRGVNSIVVQFQSKGRRGAEFMEFDEQGKVRVARAHAHVA